jgi:hypothetical protein
MSSCGPKSAAAMPGLPFTSWELSKRQQTPVVDRAAVHQTRVPRYLCRLRQLSKRGPHLVVSQVAVARVQEMAILSRQISRARRNSERSHWRQHWRPLGVVIRRRSRNCNQERRSSIWEAVAVLMCCSQRGVLAHPASPMVSI